MEFGIKLPHSGPLATPDAIRSVAIEAERLAFHSVWVHDHISYGRDWLGHRSSGLTEQITPESTPDFYESIVTLAHVAGCTSRVKLGTSILVLPLRNPLVIGRQLITLQQLCGDRLLLGVAAGDYPDEFKALGVRYEERGRITDEYLAVLHKIFHGGRVEHHGRYCDVDSAWFYPAVTPPPIIIGGGVLAYLEPHQDRLVPAVLERVARFGDGWMPDWGTPSLINEGIRTLHGLASKYGREGRHFTIAFATVLFIGDTDAQAKAITARTIGAAEETANKVAKFGLRSPEKYYSKSLIGSPESIRDKISRYAQHGVELMIMNCLAPDLASFIQTLGRFREDVQPFVNA